MFIHSLAEVVILLPLGVIQNGTDFVARRCLDGLEPRLGLFTEVLELAAGFFTDLVHFLALCLIQAKIVVKLVDIPLGGLRCIGSASCVVISDKDTGADAQEENGEDERRRL